MVIKEGHAIIAQRNTHTHTQDVNNFRWQDEASKEREREEEKKHTFGSSFIYRSQFNRKFKMLNIRRINGSSRGNNEEEKKGGGR